MLPSTLQPIEPMVTDPRLASGLSPGCSVSALGASSSEVDLFPVVYSALSCEALAARVLTRYGLGRITRCQPWNRGLSDIFLVETLGDRYIFRVSHAHWRSQDDIAFELELLDFLYRQGVPVAQPLPTRSGELWLEIPAPEGMRYGSLFAYAPGEVPLGDLDLTQGQIFGETVAQIHEVSQRFQSSRARAPLGLDQLLDSSLRSILPFFGQRPKEMEYLSDLAQEIRSQLHYLPHTAPHWTVCWGDPHSGNAHFTHSNAITLFDFDQCGYGWRVFDLAKFLQVSLRTGLSRVVREAFMRSYQSVQPLEPWELEAIRPLTQVAHLWNWSISLKTMQMHSYSRLDASFFAQRLEQLKRSRSQDWKLF